MSDTLPTSTPWYLTGEPVDQPVDRRPGEVDDIADAPRALSMGRMRRARKRMNRASEAVVKTISRVFCSLLIMTPPFSGKRPEGRDRTKPPTSAYSPSKWRRPSRRTRIRSAMRAIERSSWVTTTKVTPCAVRSSFRSVVQAGRGDRVEPGRGLVAEDQVGLEDHGPGQGGPLAHSARQLEGILGLVAAQADPAEHGPDPLGLLGPAANPGGACGWAGRRSRRGSAS